MPKSAGAIRKRHTVRQRQKKRVVSDRRKIQRGAKVKTGPVREGSGVISVGEVWDRRKSLKENYASIGLNNDVRNQRVTGQALKGGVAAQPGGAFSLSALPMTGLPPIALSDGDDGDGEVTTVPASTPIVAALENAAAEVERHNSTIGPRMTDGERKFVLSLLQKHGTRPGAYKAMAKDLKLNRYQDTAGNLRRKCERYCRVTNTSLNDWA